MFDAHLMIVNPWNYIERFADAGADIITVHYEACGDKLKETLKAIKALGVKCGAVINPNTEVKEIENFSTTTEVQQQFDYTDEDLPF